LLFVQSRIGVFKSFKRETVIKVVRVNAGKFAILFVPRLQASDMSNIAVVQVAISAEEFSPHIQQVFFVFRCVKQQNFHQGVSN
jgi:hypothetical protein